VCAVAVLYLLKTNSAATTSVYKAIEENAASYGLFCKLSTICSASAHKEELKVRKKEEGRHTLPVQLSSGPLVALFTPMLLFVF
jgi:hypothetical protein